MQTCEIYVESSGPTSKVFAIAGKGTARDRSWLVIGFRRSPHFALRDFGVEVAIPATAQLLRPFSIYWAASGDQMETPDTLEERSYLNAFTSQDNSVAFSFLV
jgi:hypothetical protein